MRKDLTGRRGAVPAAARFSASVLVLMGALSACTTTEGTNAFSSVDTFEREVMTETLAGVGIIPRTDTKPELTNHRAPLVLPKDTRALPPPTENVAEAQLPEDSDSVQIDMTGLTEQDLARLRNARVVDLHSLQGRPLTEAESRQLQARMARGTNTTARLIVPPDEYFTTVAGKDLVCLAANGDLVPLDDPSCPPAIRQALQQN